MFIYPQLGRSHIWPGKESEGKVEVFYQETDNDVCSLLPVLLVCWDVSQCPSSPVMLDQTVLAAE